MDQQINGLKSLYSEMTAPQQQTLKEVIVAYRKVPKNKSMRYTFLQELRQQTFFELQRPDQEIKRQAAEKLLFLLNE